MSGIFKFSPGVLTKVAVIFLVTAFLFGCGGGTKGTGGDQFETRLLDETGTALSGVTVTLLETGDSSITDAQGGAIIVANITGNATFLFEGPGFSARATITGIPSGSSVIRVQFTINSDRTEVDPGDVEIEDRKPSNGNDDGENDDGGPGSGDDLGGDDGANGDDSGIGDDDGSGDGGGDDSSSSDGSGSGGIDEGDGGSDGSDGSDGDLDEDPADDYDGDSGGGGSSGSGGGDDEPEE